MWLEIGDCFIKVVLLFYHKLINYSVYFAYQIFILTEHPWSQGT